MYVYLEAVVLQQTDGPRGVFACVLHTCTRRVWPVPRKHVRCATGHLPVDLDEYGIVDVLHADLQPCAAVEAQQAQGLGGDSIGSRLQRQSDDLAQRRLVRVLFIRQAPARATQARLSTSAKMLGRPHRLGSASK
jgi:hypothetical protein